MDKTWDGGGAGRGWQEECGMYGGVDTADQDKSVNRFLQAVLGRHP